MPTRDSEKPGSQFIVPRRIDVIKDECTPDSFFRLEIDDDTSYIVPIGPQLVVALIDALQRTRQMASAPQTKH